MDHSRETIEVNDCLLHRVENAYPFESEFDEPKFRLTWKNLTVHTRKKTDNFVNKIVNKFARRPETLETRTAEILKSASGYAEAGWMIGVMGPSGAGKTTLLDTLADRIRPTSGTIDINGVDASNQKISKISSYVPQFDPLPATLTTGEYVAFSCALRLDRSVSSQQREALANDIILNLTLGECRDSLISTLSGGEKKRLSLAASIVTKPRILFLDEPTTGLDTSAALHVIESIKPISTNGIVLCSIHQPSMTIFKLFSHVIFLSDGRTAFSGSLEDARIFFESEGFHCPSGFDEAEYYLEILSTRTLQNVEYSRTFTFLTTMDPATKICQAYSASKFSTIPAYRGKSRPLKFASSENKAHWSVQFNWLLWRIYLDNRRTFVDGLIAFTYYAISIILVTIFFWGIDSRKQRGIRDAMGVLYMASAEAIFSTAYTPLYEVEREIPIYRREVGLYCPSAYYIATIVSWIPKVVVKSIFLSIMLFLVVGTRATFFPTFLQFCACAIASGICGSAYGTMMASFIEDNEMATIVMAPLDLIAFLLSGIFYSLRSVTWYTVGFKYLSVFYYTNEALAIAHWSQIDHIECDSEKDLHCISTGNEVLSQYGFEKSNFWLDILGMFLLTIFMNFLGYLGMRRRRSRKSEY